MKPHSHVYGRRNGKTEALLRFITGRSSPGVVVGPKNDPKPSTPEERPRLRGSINFMEQIYRPGGRTRGKAIRRRFPRPEGM